MLENMAADSTLSETLMPVIPSADLETLLPVLTELSITDYIVL